jgi:hypothetical protein
MSMVGNTQTLKQERVIFFGGQRLTAGDLTAAQDVSRSMRWLHNSSLHNWGIGFGLAVSGERGAREVTVGPGYALDVKGREIVLAEAETLPVPPLAGANGEPEERDLTIAYRTEDEVVETREGICLPRGAVRLSRAPVIGWLETAEVRNGFDIVLARANILNCQLNEPLSTTQRRNARPTQQPYIASGQTLKGHTSWERWLADVSGSQVVLGYKVKVDTSPARFHTTPHYLVRVVGERFAPVEFRERLRNRWPERGRDWNNLGMDSLVEGFSSVAEAGPTSFTLRILLPRNDANNPHLNRPSWLTRPDLAELALRELWYAVWVGIEG